MHFKVKLSQIGNSLGVIFPKEALAVMQVGKGDTLTFTSAPDGFRVTPYDLDQKSQFEVMRHVMKKRRNALCELAK